MRETDWEESYTIMKMSAATRQAAADIVAQESSAKAAAADAAAGRRAAAVQEAQVMSAVDSMGRLLEQAVGTIVSRCKKVGGTLDRRAASRCLASTTNKKWAKLSDGDQLVDAALEEAVTSGVLIIQDKGWCLP